MSWDPPQAALLPDGKRLHLHHGPIDLIIEVFSADPAPYYDRATARFQTILTGLVRELDLLRQPLIPSCKDPTARRMARAVSVHNIFVTPMAAVAGAVADEVLAAMIADTPPAKAYVNNGGDIAFHLGAGKSFTAASPAGPMTITAKDTPRGIATSGWRGRSHSLGIADTVTVAAKSAAAADVAATLIANAVNLPAHPAITRSPANMLSPDSDLGPRFVTTDVGPLGAADIAKALAAGATQARRLCAQGIIHQAALSLQGQSDIITATHAITGDLAHA